MAVPSSFGVELLHANRLPKIAYTTGSLEEATVIDASCFPELFGCHYTESMYGSADFQVPLAKPDFVENNKISVEQVKERLEHPLDCFVICETHTPIGRSLRASKDIPAEEVLFLYNGTIQKQDPNDAYTYSLLGVATDKTGGPIGVSAKKLHGMAGFMPHLPPNVEQDPELSYLNFKNPELKNQIAKANVLIYLGVLNGVPIAVCWNPYGIKAGDTLGFNYGLRYWKGDQPLYLDKQARPISTSEYTVKTLEEKGHERYEAAMQKYQAREYNVAIRILKEAVLFYRKDPEKVTRCLSKVVACYEAMGDHATAKLTQESVTAICESLMVI